MVDLIWGFGGQFKQVEKALSVDALSYRVKTGV